MIFDKKPAGALDPIANPSIPRTVPRNCLPPCAIIDASVNIEGDLTTDGDVQIDGHINGNVNCARLTVGKDGILSGDITAKEVVVRGTVTGTIRATRVMLLESARRCRRHLLRQDVHGRRRPLCRCVQRRAATLCCGPTTRPCLLAGP